MEQFHCCLTPGSGETGKEHWGRGNGREGGRNHCWTPANNIVIYTTGSLCFKVKCLVLEVHAKRQEEKDKQRDIFILHQSQAEY